MISLFRVTYMDPRGQGFNMEAYDVLARNALEAIRRADSLKTIKLYRPESVERLGTADK